MLCMSQHNVFMWTIEKYLHETEDMMQRLGYKLHVRMIWVKSTGFAPAFTVRFLHEYLCWFYKTSKMIRPRKEVQGKYSTIIKGSSPYHSKKPESVYEMLEDMFPQTPKLELFARNTRSGWDCWGNEV